MAAAAPAASEGNIHRTPRWTNCGRGVFPASSQASYNRTWGLTFYTLTGQASEAEEFVQSKIAALSMSASRTACECCCLQSAPQYWRRGIQWRYKARSVAAAVVVEAVSRD